MQRLAEITNCFLWAGLAMLAAASAEAGQPPAKALSVPGGLCVQVGGQDLTLATELARTGRFLVHILETDGKAVERAREQLSDAGILGLAFVEQVPAVKHLPYAENLVNLLVVNDAQTQLPADEVNRVVCPNGIVLTTDGAKLALNLEAAGLESIETIKVSDDNWLRGRKPWPTTMDMWSHPRHSAAGNAVSADTVVGPPRRVRWLAGPWQEVSTMVSADGRNYYGGLMTRDGFNGLRLWDKELKPSPAAGGFGGGGGRAVPVAGDGRVFVYSDGELQALDGGSGKSIRAFSASSQPRQLLYSDGRLIAVEDDKVSAFDADAGKLLWTFAAADPRFVVAGDDIVSLIYGNARRGEPSTVVTLDPATGKVRWKQDDFPWAAKVSNCVYYQGMLAFEESSLNDNGPGNALHIVTTSDGKTRLDHDFFPGMNHKRQARAMFVDNTLWLLHGGKDADKKRLPTQISAVDYLTGEIRVTHPAGLAHCFPPVATPKFLLSGEMNLTDLRTGTMDANHITKAACGRDSGWVPANGLIYVTPKHCVCWPMLRGYAALASARPGGNPALVAPQELDFVLEAGQAAAPRQEQPASTGDADWPCYRHDAWRSASTTAAGPAKLQALWSADLGKLRGVSGPITQDWDENPYVKGPVSAPVIDQGRLFVARPDAHQVVAMDAASGEEQWRFTANGRVDSPPTIHRGLCLFGAKSGWVYCLRADSGQLVWKLRAAPLDERIVAYGGIESPWPVPGSVLVVDEVAYFAAGRQSLADGGILIFAVDPSTGAQQWVSRLDTVPQKGFYESSGLEFDNFDLLFRQGEDVAMSRWVFNRKSGEMQVNRWEAFARLNTGKGSAMVPQGCWSYAPRNQRRTQTFSPRRPLVVFRDNLLLGCLESKQSIYRRDFNLEGGEEFSTKWITGWAGSQASRKEDGEAWRSQRLAKDAKWTVDVVSQDKEAESTIDALALAGDRLYVATSAGELQVISTSDGEVLEKRRIAPPLWDGLAIAQGRLYISTADGKVLCFGEQS